MKKKYVKPELFFESFEMNTAIANCGWKTGTTHADGVSCEWNGDFNEPVFTQANNLCGIKGGDDTSDSFCYHNPDDDRRIFNS